MGSHRVSKEYHFDCSVAREGQGVVIGLISALSSTLLTAKRQHDRTKYLGLGVDCTVLGS